MADGRIIELQNLPPGPPEDLDKSDALGEWLTSWVLGFFNVQIIIDVGSEQAVSKGDYFSAVHSNTSVKGLSGEDLGSIVQDGSLIRVVEAHPKFSVCQMESYDYKRHMDSMPAIIDGLADADGTFDIEANLRALGPLIVGQEVIGVPAEERDRRDAIEDLYDQSLSDEASDAQKAFYYGEMVRRANQFLLDFSQGYFVPSVLFQKGYAQFNLGEYQDSIDTFDLFLDRYPFHTSAEGAQSWTDKAKALLVEERSAKSAAGPPEAAADEPSRARQSRQNPWISGSFYLVAFAVIAAVLLVAANTVSLAALPVVAVAAILAISTIGAFQLKQDSRLSDKSFLELMVLNFKRLPLLTPGARKDSEPNKSVHPD